MKTNQILLLPIEALIKVLFTARYLLTGGNKKFLDVLPSYSLTDGKSYEVTILYPEQGNKALIALHVHSGPDATGEHLGTYYIDPQEVKQLKIPYESERAS